MVKYEQDVTTLVQAAPSGERATWQKPQWRIIDAKDAEVGFTVASADGTFNAS
jgi:hypothetical protein